MGYNSETNRQKIEKHLAESVISSENSLSYKYIEKNKEILMEEE